MASDLKAAHDTLREFALTFPGAYEEFPWGEPAIKVNKKAFVFFGLTEQLDTELRFALKLTFSNDHALQMPFAKPTRYGLGTHGWVSMLLTPDDEIPLDLLQDWIEESYRNVAPKRLVAQLDQQIAIEAASRQL
jgi:predicted DNA-binding protein (MmcQ/YjbR family)